MREIEIYENYDKNFERSFIKTENKSKEYPRFIKCAYDLTQACSPDCAACQLYGVTLKACCNKEGEGFDIGFIK